MSIYIRINGRAKTGGPMAMFQLGQALESACCNVTIVYDDEPSKDVFKDWHANFLSGTSKYILFDAVKDVKGQVFVATETSIYEFDSIDTSNRIWLYMLSVDNCISYGISPIKFDAKFRHLKNLILNIPNSITYSWKKISNRIEIVLSQSSYANDVLSRIRPSVPYYFIGDYVNYDKVNNVSNIDFSKKTKLKAAYNPTKGKLYFKVANFFSKKLQFVPIVGIKPVDLPDFFSNIDIYIDFGGQPGKDRLPREALICGKPSFVFKRGAAVNGSDFPSRADFRLGIFDLLNLDNCVYSALRNKSALDHVARLCEILVEKEALTLRVKRLIDFVRENNTL